jgi:tRNA modification GTPase
LAFPCVHRASAPEFGARRRPSRSPRRRPTPVGVAPASTSVPTPPRTEADSRAATADVGLTCGVPSSSHDTIVAVASARGPAARGVVRLSGRRAVALVAARCGVDAAAFPPRGAHARPAAFGLDTPTATVRGAQAPVELWVFRAPASYTGEDVVELHLPGSPALLDLVVRLCVADGARVADPGEFTRRAVEAGKLDLTRAEAVLAAVRARDDDELRRAQALLDGGLARELAGAVDRLTALLVPLELALDFSDQDVEIVAPVDHARKVAALAADLRRLAAAPGGAVLRGLFRVVLRGPANAGKSSLFNALLGRDAALAAPFRGTTRDPLTAEFERGGVRCVLTDTAGDDVFDGPLDAAAGAARERALGEADLVLEVRDVRRGGFPDAPPPGAPPALRVATFVDLAPDVRVPAGALRVAAPTGEGIAALGDAIAAALSRGADAAPFLVSARVAGAAAEAADALDRAVEALPTEPPEFAASDLRAALRALRGLTHADPADPVLDRIFRDFCIGK